MLAIESSLQIRLTRQAGRVSEVSICSSRPLQAPRLFHGKSIDEMLGILPLLYHVCGIAQASAAVAACEQAMAITASPATLRAREMLVWMETAREHLWRIMLDWAQSLTLPRQAPAVTQLQQGLAQLKPALFADGEAFRPGAQVGLQRPAAQAVIRQLAVLMETEVFACAPEQWLALADRSALRAWLENTDTVAARMLREVSGQMGGQESDRNRVAVPFLPQLREAALHKRFMQGDAEAFVAEPLWQGLPHETTALARQRQHPLISDMLVTQGNGILTRMAARLVELASIPARLQRLLDELPEHPPSNDRAGPKLANGQGIGQVEAARGRLIHRLELGQGVIRRYQILAPTEWNFHPQGIAAQLLKALPAEDETRLRSQADLLINAIDPCVRYEMTVHNA